MCADPDEQNAGYVRINVLSRAHSGALQSITGAEPAVPAAEWGDHLSNAHFVRSTPAVAESDSPITVDGDLAQGVSRKFSEYAA